jgi:hypothetical protein
MQQIPDAPWIRAAERTGYPDGGRRPKYFDDDEEDYIYRYRDEEEN